MKEGSTQRGERPRVLEPYLSPAGAWAFSIGTSIGWGSLVITGSTYLAEAGPMGSVLGMLVGLAIMLVVARSYHYLMDLHPGPGGVYAYARDVFGYDHGVLVAWFLSLIYAAILWANATSLPLFARYFLGDLFRFGALYQLFGYDVYLGEVLLSVCALLLAGLFCQTRKRGISNAMIAMAVLFSIGITVCFAVAMLSRDASQFRFDPAFVPDSDALSQVLHVACMSSWAFIGFESISHSSGEFTFSTDKSFRVLVVALVSTTALYIFVTLLSVTAYPAQYHGWLEYIQDLGSTQGIEGIPAFFAARYYLGSAGVGMLMLALLALILSSLVGNIVALSRLLFALGQDHVIPGGLDELNERAIPAKAIRLIIAVSIFVPLLGRTAIGWIVDVTTLGATFVYGFVSVCAYREGQRRHNAHERLTGAVGTVLMALIGAYLMLPSLLSGGNMATESYFLFTVWALLGFLFFRHLLLHDDERRFGQSIVSWVALLALVLFASLAWMGETTGDATGKAMESVHEYFGGESATVLAEADEEYMRQTMETLNNSIARGIAVMAGLFTFSLGIMLSNFAIMQRREAEAQQIANRDPLTGVKSKHAYVTREAELNEQIAAGSLAELAVVVCDVNDLKLVNDTLGHKAGDEHIRQACRIICQLFKHSPVFRIGGDEFVVLLQGSDYESRSDIMAALDAQSVANKADGGPVVAAGLSEFAAGSDARVQEVLDRADSLMYQRKVELKDGEPVR